MAAALNERIGTANVSNVLISGFSRVEGERCELGSTLTLDLESALSEQRKTYRLLDRQNLSALAEEHKLDMEGMMDDEQIMREAGKLLKADVMLFGYYTFTTDLLVLRVKALDIQTSEQIVVLSRNCMVGSMIKSLCNGATEHSRNTSPAVQTEPAKPIIREVPKEPIVSSTSTECMTKRLGNYCLKNNGSVDVSLFTRMRTAYGGQTNETLRVRPGKTECFLSKPEGSYKYTLSEVRPRNPVYPTNTTKVVSQGSFQITPCGNGQMTYP